MAARYLPAIYTLSPRSPRAEGVYFRQIPSSHGITDIFHSTPSEKVLPCFGSLFILDFENFNCDKNVRATIIVINISATFECGLYMCHYEKKV